jgi:hypothetical protein
MEMQCIMIIYRVVVELMVELMVMQDWGKRGKNNQPASQISGQQPRPMSQENG